MNADVKREWVTALRSGEYKQAREQLCLPDGAMCCLGVLIDACIDGEWDAIEKREWQTEPIGWQFDGSSTGLSVMIRERVGMTYDETESLVELNDKRGWKFPAIAKWIEANL